MYCTSVPFHETGSARKRVSRRVESLADVAPRREEETLLARWNRGELGAGFAIRLRALTTLKDDEVSCDAVEAGREVLEVIPASCHAPRSMAANEASTLWIRVLAWMPASVRLLAYPTSSLSQPCAGVGRAVIGEARSQRFLRTLPASSRTLDAPCRAAFARSSMATRKATTALLTDAIVAEAEARVRAEGFVAARQLVSVKLSRSDQLMLIEKLAVRGLERTPRGMRVPVVDQVMATVDDEPAPLKTLSKRLRGANVAETKRAALALAGAADLALVSTTAGDAVTRPGRHVLGPAELDAMRDAAKLLAKLGTRVRARKGAPPKTLARKELRAALAALLALVGDADHDAVDVLECLGELQRARGRSVFIPDLVRALGLQGQPEAAHEKLLALAREGHVELRPESGVGNLSGADRALCPSDARGAVISYARVIHEAS